MLDKIKIKKILVISLSNIGDIILTFPVIDVLRHDFPDAQLSVVIGPKGKELLQENPYLKNIYIFHKNQTLLQMFRWVHELRKEQFDLVVDLRNTAFPFFIFSRVRTSPFLKRMPGQHMREQHLTRLASVHPFVSDKVERRALFVPSKDQEDVGEILRHQIGLENNFIVVAPGAADRGKRWPAQEFARLCDDIIKTYQAKIVFIGDKNDQAVVQQIRDRMAFSAVDLSGKTTLTQLAALLERSPLLITNDSAPMHMASYLQTPVLAVFGPTDPEKYGPWSQQNCVVDRRVLCQACHEPKEKVAHDCMMKLKAEDVFNAFTLTPQGVRFKFPVC